jgi:hypothetical protein
MNSRMKSAKKALMMLVKNPKKWPRLRRLGLHNNIYESDIRSKRARKMASRCLKRVRVKFRFSNVPIITNDDWITNLRGVTHE